MCYCESGSGLCLTGLVLVDSLDWEENFQAKAGSWRS